MFTLYNNFFKKAHYIKLGVDLINVIILLTHSLCYLDPMSLCKETKVTMFSCYSNGIEEWL